MQEFPQDFDAYLLPQARARLHRTRLYKKYIAHRARVRALVEMYDAVNGARASNVILFEMHKLEERGAALRAVMERLQAGAARKATSAYTSPCRKSRSKTK